MSSIGDNINIIQQITEAQRKHFSELGHCEANAVLVGMSIDLRALGHKSSGRYDPVLVELPSNGFAMIYHYGVIVFFNATVSTTAELIARCRSATSQMLAKPETEQFSISIRNDLAEGVKNDTIQIKEITTERIEIIGDSLSKSVVLDYHENRMSALFDKIEPIAKSLHQKGKLGFGTKMLLKQIGSSLIIANDMAGKVEISEKPSVLWDHVELEPLYAQLIEDLEIIERQVILERKNSVISNTVQTSLEVLQSQHGHRLEWYIIILIAIEILLDLYEKFFAHLHA